MIYFSLLNGLIIYNDNIVSKWRLWHIGGYNSFWCEMHEVKRAKGFGRFLGLLVSGGKLWLGDTLVDESTLWISGRKTQSSLFSFSTFAHNISTYEKFRTQTSLSLSLSMNSNSATSSASSATQAISYLWTVEGPARHFLISKEDWDETVIEGT